jgi:CelD/BcsL family acetyltransferase involved in cellulose biosynthesis
VVDKFSARTVSPSDLTAIEIDRWNALCQLNPALKTPFMSATFTRIAAEVFPGVRICVIEVAGEPAAFFPFQFRSTARQTLGYAERVGGELSDYFGIVGTAGLRLNENRLLSLAKLHGMLFSHLDSSQREFGLAGEDPEVGLRINLDKGGEAYWEDRRTVDKHFVADTERCRRRLEEKFGPIQFEYKTSDPLSHLDHLIELKRAQYARTGVPDVLRSDRARAFLRLLALSNDATCEGIVTTMFVGDKFAASHFGLQGSGTLHYWWPVFDPDLRSYSPGRLLLQAVIRKSTANGVNRIDLGAGDTPAKRDFANGENRYLRGFWRRNNAQAFAIHAYQSVLWRLDRRAAILASQKQSP